MTEAQKAAQAKYAQEITELKGRLSAAEQEIVDRKAGGGLAVPMSRNAIFEALKERSAEIASIAKTKGNVQIDIPLVIGRKSTLTGGTGDSPSTSWPGFISRIPGVGNDPRLPVQVLSSVFASAAVPGDTVDSVELDDDFVSGAAYQLNEGDAKGETSAGFTRNLHHVATIAHYIKASNQVLSDNVGLSGWISSILSYGVLRKLDIELVLGAGGSGQISGMTTFATPIVETGTMGERIAKAALSLKKVGFRADTVLINVDDDFAARSVKASGSGEYLLPPDGVYFGLTPVPSVDIAPGTAYVFDSNQGLILNRQSVQTDIGFVNDDFTKNLITIRCELRAGFMVRSPKAFKSVALT